MEQLKTLTLLIAALLISTGIPAKWSGDPGLAQGKKVFVMPAERDVEVAMSNELQKWRRWNLVASEKDAELLVKLQVSGSAAWGLGHVQAFIVDAYTDKTLWTSKVHKGTRTIFHGYASPYTRAISGIAKQMRDEIR